MRPLSGLTDYLLEILKIFLANASINDPLVQAIIELFEEFSFVDDLFGGADDLELVAQIISKLISILQNYGIELCKWASNDKRFLQPYQVKVRQTN